jgi:diaminopimelate decarboxylase
MRHFNYVNGNLHAENVPLATIANAVGTPTFIYSRATLEHHYKVFTEALSGLPIHVAFAVKANTSRAVIATLAACGAGADTVSEGEIRRALHAGVPASGIVFAGVGKTDAELLFALEAGIRQINIESAQELDRLSSLAAGLGRVQDVAIRVNPDVGAGGHAKITTGNADNKFGVSMGEALELYARAAALPGVNPVGLSVHIGSQIIDLAPMEQAYRKLAEAVGVLRGQGLAVSRLDLGGGLAATYDDAGVVGPDLGAYGAMVKRVCGGLDVELEFEPGRMICANAGVLLTRAVVTKSAPTRDFLVLDAAMNDLLRPTLYEAYHQIMPVKEAVGDNRAPVDVVGPICETGDTFATGRALPAAAPGDLIAMMSTGAYGFSMASTYNSRPLAAEVMVSGDQWRVIRPRQTWDEMYGTEVLPDWV